MSTGAIAERYAQAVFDLGQETGQLAALSSEIRRFADAYLASPELRAVLENPMVPEPAREGVLREIATRLTLSPHALNTLRLLLLRRRLRVVPDIARELSRLADEKAGVLRATVVSARPLTEDHTQRLVRALEKRTHKKVLLEKQTDPTLIAGIVTKIGDHTIDGSLRGRLSALGRQLLTTT